jgi:hypothetical protein
MHDWLENFIIMGLVGVLSKIKHNPAEVLKYNSYLWEAKQVINALPLTPPATVAPSAPGK